MIDSPVKDLPPSNLNRIFLGVIVLAIVLGGILGILLGNKKNTSSLSTELDNKPVTSAQQDKRTFRDFAEGKIEKRPAPKNPEDYIEGTHMLIRDGAVPVALTSSVVDLSQYEGKRVKVFGETQKAIKEGWLMDVGKVETK